MKINWKRWVALTLPACTRKPGILALACALTAPLRALNALFTLWQKTVRRRACATCQTCMIERIVFDEMGMIITIEEGDGKPFDFNIKADINNVDVERRVLAIVNQYKQAGKRYGYNNKKVDYAVEWGGFFCETGSENVSWGGFVCEKNTLTPNWIHWSLPNYKLYFFADYPVESDLTITYRYHLPINSDIVTRETKISKGQTDSPQIPLPDGSVMEEVSVTPQRDYKYEYKFYNIPL